MNSLTKLMCAAAIAVGTTGTAIASPVLNNWVFNPNGGGFAKGQVVNEYLDINGNAFIQLTATGGTSFDITETAVFNIVQADSKGKLFPLNYQGGNITATFEATGTGNFGGSFAFSKGTVRMYQNPNGGQYGGTNGLYGANLGNMIAEFSVLGGGGLVDESGVPTRNGQVSVFAQAAPGMLDAGYFFDGAGKDLSTESILSFAFTNANTIGSPTGNLVNEVACQFASFKGPGCTGGTYRNRPGQYFFIGSNGQFKLAEGAQVPEPGSFALFGIALLAAGATVRKRKALLK
ncbi:flocculation-associated PEP-CTERM protein PepA [Massilia sp. CMS3.1]|uniref:flocculation-associated PEP-CTERM protein PepA n=1 Tax=Massilia sp. CMS3.1 TaxID=3373083 RepID=UPI003EE54969